MLSPSSSSSAIAAFAFGLSFFSAILEITRWPSRPHAQAGPTSGGRREKRGRKRRGNGRVSGQS